MSLLSDSVYLEYLESPEDWLISRTLKKITSIAYLGQNHSNSIVIPVKVELSCGREFKTFFTYCHNTLQFISAPHLRSNPSKTPFPYPVSITYQARIEDLLQEVIEDADFFLEQ